jgi:hypothetical protein
MSAFSFALQESRLLEKAASWIQPFGWFLAFRGQKPKPKAKPNTPLFTFFQKMKTKTSPLYFVKSGPPKSPPMEVGCELQLLSGRKSGIYNT